MDSRILFQKLFLCHIVCDERVPAAETDCRQVRSDDEKNHARGVFVWKDVNVGYRLQIGVSFVNIGNCNLQYGQCYPRLSTQLA